MNAADPIQIDDLGQKPVLSKKKFSNNSRIFLIEIYTHLVTLYEAAPKDKKQKEDKSTPIGQAILDLWPLLKGETQVPATIIIHPIPGSFLETQTDQNQVLEKMNY
jgi:hypothetical protein